MEIVNAILRGVWRRRGDPPLRRCPVCAADAVATHEYELLPGLQAAVLQRCGQCGVWRQIVTDLYVAERHERTLEADRNAIRRHVERLESVRMVADRRGHLGAPRSGAVTGEPDDPGEEQLGLL